eukprot:7570779-Pyramimonas_sp.AAC.1
MAGPTPCARAALTAEGPRHFGGSRAPIAASRALALLSFRPRVPGTAAPVLRGAPRLAGAELEQ